MNPNPRTVFFRACPQCGTGFLVTLQRYNEAQKHNRAITCSRACAAVLGGKRSGEARRADPAKCHRAGGRTRRHSLEWITQRTPKPKPRHKPSQFRFPVTLLPHEPGKQRRCKVDLGNGVFLVLPATPAPDPGKLALLASRTLLKAVRKRLKDSEPTHL